MVKVSYQQKPYRRDPDGELWRAGVCQPDRPHGITDASLLAKGSAERRVARASPFPRRWKWRPNPNGAKNYSLGSVLNHVLMHQTVIGEEALKQMEMAGRISGRGDRLRRRRQQLRRHCLPLRPREPQARQKDPHHRRGAAGLPVDDQGHVRLRLRRHAPRWRRW